MICKKQMGDMMQIHNDQKHNNKEAQCVRAACAFYLAAQSKVAENPEWSSSITPNDEEMERIEAFHLELERAARLEFERLDIEEILSRNPGIALPLLDTLVEILRRCAPDEFLKTCVTERPEETEEICRHHQAHHLAALLAP